MQSDAGISGGNAAADTVTSPDTANNHGGVIYGKKIINGETDNML